MTARFTSSMHTGNRSCAYAAACTSAPVIDIMDTAVILVVSIIVLRLRLWGLA